MPQAHQVRLSLLELRESAPGACGMPAKKPAGGMVMDASGVGN